MTTQQQQEHFEKLMDKMRKTMLSKGNDYSNNDRLANFKQVGAICNISPAKVALVLMAVKISRLCNLLDSGVKPENEAMADTSLDLAVYSILNDACLNEK
jgi:hypothetical protein